MYRYMESTYNRQEFSEKEIKEGRHLKFLESLIDLQINGEYGMDIKLSFDSMTFCVDWCNFPYDRSYGGSFEYIGESDEIGEWRHTNEEGKCIFVPKDCDKEEEEYFKEVETTPKGEE